jgi:hypothetical protein
MYKRTGETVYIVNVNHLRTEDGHFEERNKGKNICDPTHQTGY